MISRNGHLNFKVSKAECKLTRTSKLVVLPSDFITVFTHAGVPLCHGVIVISIFWKIFITTSCTTKAEKISTVSNFIIPIKVKRNFLTRLQRSRQIHFHHCFVDHIFQRLTHDISEFSDHKTISIIAFSFIKTIQQFISHLRLHRIAGLIVCIVSGAVLVLVQLQPEITQYIR